MCLQCRVAVKIEKPLKGKFKVSQLKNEFKVLTQLNKNGKLLFDMTVSHLPILNPVPSLCPALVRGVPKVLHYGHCGARPCLVMEELGPNLEDLMQENICKGAKNI